MYYSVALEREQSKNDTWNLEKVLIYYCAVAIIKNTRMRSHKRIKKSHSLYVWYENHITVIAL